VACRGETPRLRTHQGQDASKKFIQKSKEAFSHDIPGIETMTVCGNKTVLMFLIAAD